MGLKILRIFDIPNGNSLYTVQYEGEALSEYERLKDCWDDVSYLYDFHKKNSSAINLAREIWLNEIHKDFDALFNALEALRTDRAPTLSRWFRPLSPSERTDILYLRCKRRSGYLRLYALEIEPNCFLIIGGAIKITETMQDHEDTRLVLKRFEQCRDFLVDKEVYIFDRASLSEHVDEADWDED